MTIGNKIKQRRLELGLTQQQLADRLGKTKSAVCRVERDKEQNLTLDRVTEFAKALDCTESYLMSWDQDKPVEDVLHDYQKKGTSLAHLIKYENLFEAFQLATELEEQDKIIVINLIKSLHDKKNK